MFCCPRPSNSDSSDLPTLGEFVSLAQDYVSAYVCQPRKQKMLDFLYEVENENRGYLLETVTNQDMRDFIKTADVHGVQELQSILSLVSAIRKNPKCWEGSLAELHAENIQGVLPQYLHHRALNEGFYGSTEHWYANTNKGAVFIPISYQSLERWRAKADAKAKADAEAEAEAKAIGSFWGWISKAFRGPEMKPSPTRYVIEALQAETQRLKKEKSVMTQAIEGLRAETQRLKKEKTVMTQDIEAMIAENELLEEEKGVAIKAVKELFRERAVPIEALKVEYKKLEKEKAGAIKALQAEIKKLKAEEYCML